MQNSFLLRLKLYFFKNEHLGIQRNRLNLLNLNSNNCLKKLCLPIDYPIKIPFLSFLSFINFLSFFLNFHLPILN